MFDYKEMNTPAVFDKNDNQVPFKDYTLYMNLVGNLIYLSVVSWLNIAFAMGNISQKMSNPIQGNWIAAKRILRYLKKVLLKYSNSDWNGDLKTKISTSGYMFTLVKLP